MDEQQFVGLLEALLQRMLSRIQPSSEKFLFDDRPFCDAVLLRVVPRNAYYGD